jgi:tripartite-type tricarboxylate transporter receptor subunit TctC
MRTFLWLRAALLSLAMALAPVAMAWADYPDKPLQVYMPGAPGGSFDIMTRLVMQKLSERLKQAVIVTNIPGAGGMLAVERGMRAEPDGYHVIIGYVGNLAVAPWIYPKMNYDPVKDVKPVVLLGAVTYIAAVPANSPFKTLEELLAYARANPGKLNFASAGNGTGGHLGGELVKSIAKVNMVHVPYQGAGPASIALLGSQVDWAIEALPTALPNVKGGKLRALAVTSPNRDPQLPDVPTMAEIGFPGFELQSWLGVMVPPKTPDDIVKRLNAEINAILQTPELKAAYSRSGATTLGGTPEDFSVYLKSEIDKYGKVIKSSNATAD